MYKIKKNKIKYKKEEEEEEEDKVTSPSLLGR
jgi:hypothetical protein